LKLIYIHSFKIQRHSIDISAEPRTTNTYLSLVFEEASAYVFANISFPQNICTRQNSGIFIDNIFVGFGGRVFNRDLAFHGH